MKNNYIKIITCIALVSILILQGIWLYSTYMLLETEFRKNFKSLFTAVVHKDAVDRLNDPNKKGTWKHKIIEGYKMENDIYTNIIALQNDLYLEEDTFSIENLDNILNKSLKEENLGIVNYSLSLVDSLGNNIKRIDHGSVKNLFYEEKIQLRTIDPEF
ncbi:MAG: hypothetical protein LBQ73_05965, partial [Tannerellaceae bacterium]|nr:hypothetical protein [Tannerellaceae bacterium]